MSTASDTGAQAPDHATGESLCAALRAQAARLGLSLGDEPVWAAATLATEIDPASQQASAVAVWRGGERYGKATFFPDGRVFAEYQVLQAHPARAGIWVDAVQVWGSPAAWRGDAVLAEMP